MAYIVILSIVASIFIWNLVNDSLSPYLARRVSVVSKRSIDTSTRYGMVVKSHYRVTFQLLDDSYKIFTLRDCRESSLAKAYYFLEIGCKGILYTRRDKFLGMSKIQDHEDESLKNNLQV
jgi:hypothetical protein